MSDFEVFEFRVIGTPQQRGSKQAHARYDKQGKPITKDGRVLTFAKDDNPKSKAWMDSVRTTAAEYCGSRDLLAGPLILSVMFQFSRPSSHYGTGRNEGVLKASAPQHKESTPDLSKLLRALEDALTGVVWRDDRQVVQYDKCVKCWTTGTACADVQILKVIQP